MKAKERKAFTMMELLTAIGIVAIMIGILMPAIGKVKKLARDTKQNAQLQSIDMGLNLYKNDFGDYPPSRGSNKFSGIDPNGYCGAQTLTEAMFGQDLLGFHPSSFYDPCDIASGHAELYEDPDNANLDARKDPYLQRENIDVFVPRGGVFDTTYFNSTSAGSKLMPGRYMICDVFSAVTRPVELPTGPTTTVTKSYKIGTPILYFKANTASNNINSSLVDASKRIDIRNRIYNFLDNHFLVELGKITNKQGSAEIYHTGFITKGGSLTPPDATGCDPFYTFITDPMASNFTGTNQRMRPVRPDSFLLISAGSDSLFGTKDDICNFTPNLE